MKKLLLASAASALVASAALAGSHSKEVKIGVLLGFTGPLESITPHMAGGAELAMAEVNAAGGILDGTMVTAVRGDSTCVDAAAATAAAERLITSEGVAALMGVKPDVVISATFIIGAILAALAGVMYASNYGTAQHTMGFLPGLKAFTAAVFGGIGNLGGAVLGGILLGLIESIGAGYIGPLTGGVLGSQYSDIFAFIVLIFVLTLRPSGLLGERVADRA